MNKKKHTEMAPNSDETADFTGKGPLTLKEDATEKPEADNATPEARQESRNAKAIQAFRNLTSDEDDKPNETTKLTLASILGGDILGGRWFRKQFWYIVMVVAMIIVYVGNRYACQQEMIQTKMLNDTLLDRRYKALTRSSQLKVKTRRSYIEESIADSTIQTSNIPSFNLKVEE